MRTLLLELRPAALVEAKLADLIRQLGEATVGRARLEIDLQVQDVDPLPAEVKVALYRIIQEAINNVVKHAQAQHVTVTLQRNDGKIMLRIVDDGRGFDRDRIPSDHFGLGNMRERAEAIGAQLDIESEPGIGTEIQVRWENASSP
jgi:signal transduction histidine kinase